MGTFVGLRDANGTTRLVLRDDGDKARELPAPDEANGVGTHGLYGWGNTSGGAGQTAYAILREVWPGDGPDIPGEAVDQFMRDVISTLPDDEFELDEATVRAWIAANS